MRFGRSIALATIALAATCGVAQAQTPPCAPGFQLLEGQTVDVEMTVKSGKFCRIRLANSMGGMTGAEVLSRPSVGKAEAVGLAMIYTAKAGHVGTDAFKWAWVGKNKYGKDVSWPIAVKVTVVP